MRRGIVVAAVVGASACGVAEEPCGTERGGMEAADAHFLVALDPETTEATVVQKIAEAGRPELAAACADRPGALVRIFNPLEPGAFADVTCASVLSNDAARQDESVVPVSEGDEPIGETQQRWSPLGLGCHIFILASAIIAHRGICPRATNPRDARRCENWSDAGFGGLTIACAFL